MPSTTKKQHNFMEAVAHSPAFAKKVGIKQSVGKDFEAADKGKKFGLGGDVKVTRGGKGMINKQATRAGSIFGEQKEVPNVNLNKFVGKKEGGKIMKHDDVKEDKKLIKQMVKPSAVKPGMAKGGQARSVSKGEHPVQKKAKEGAQMIKMAKGGRTMVKGDHPVQTKAKKGAIMVSMCGGGKAK